MPGHPTSVRIFGLCAIIAAAACLSAAPVDAPLYSVYELELTGPSFDETDKTAEITFYTEWQHESGSPVYKIHGFWDGDGAGGTSGNVFKVRFCPTQTGTWTLTRTVSDLPLLDGQKEGTVVNCVPSGHHGFWEPDGIWFKRSDGAHQYVVGNVHYCLVIYDGRLDDVRGNAEYYKKIRFFLTLLHYNTDYTKGMPFFDSNGEESIEAESSSRPNPAFYHKADEIVKEAYGYDLICDMYAEAQTGAIKNDYYLKYVAARFGSFPNVWLQLDVEWNEYLTVTQTKEIGTRLRSYLPYPTPLSVISTMNWNSGLNGPWCTHVCIQGKVFGLNDSKDAIVSNRQKGGGIPCNNDDNGPNGFQNEDKGITAEVETERILGCFLGAGYSGTGHEISGPGYSGPFWTGGFDVTQHTCSRNLKYMRETIDSVVMFWEMEPDVGSFTNATGFEWMGWDSTQYVLGSNEARTNVVAELPPGEWRVDQFDLMAMESTTLATDAAGSYSFSTPNTVACMTVFTKDGVTAARAPARRAGRGGHDHRAGRTVTLYDLRGAVLGTSTGNEAAAIRGGRSHAPGVYLLHGCALPSKVCIPQR